MVALKMVGKSLDGEWTQVDRVVVNEVNPCG
jgi:hypothetical protein